MSHYRALLGDCEDLLPTLEPRSIDALITDPPYSSGGQFRGDRMSKPSTKYQNSGTEREYFEFLGDNRDQRSWLLWCELWLKACKPLLKPGAVFALFTDWRQLPTLTDAVQVAGFIWRGVAVWNKTEAARPQLGRFRAQAEFVVWGSLGPLATERGVGALPGVFTNYQAPGERVHMTEKPVPVMHWLNRFCPPGGTILDPFMGGGSGGVAALEGGYNYIGMELVPELHAYAQGRLANVTPLLTTVQPTLFGPDLDLLDADPEPIAS